MRVTSLAALAASLSVAVAQDKYLGFNSGATTDQYKVKLQADFEQEFSAQQKLKNAPGYFNSVRLYTNIQPNTDDTPILAIPAAIKTKTRILLGMWASGTTNIDKELSALNNAIKQYGKDFTDLVIGISVGSEDLYRASADGISNKSGVGQDIPTLLKFIQNTRDALKNTALASTPVGHVDTWTIWANGTNKAVVDAVDFLGTDIYPYYENGQNIKMSNEINNAAALFTFALNATVSSAGGKPVWVTETGWPVSGEKWNDAVPSVDNAQTYWQNVGCPLFNQTTTFWYTLRDSNPDNTMKFGLDPELDGNPKYDLTCSKKAVSSSSSSASRSSTASASASSGSVSRSASRSAGSSASATATGTASASASPVASYSAGFSAPANSAVPTASTTTSPSTAPVFTGAADALAVSSVGPMGLLLSLLFAWAL